MIKAFNILRVVLLLFALIGVLSLPAYAQTSKKVKNKYVPIKPDTSSYFSDAHYTVMIDQLLANPKNFRYNFFRRHYMTSRFYDPLADSIRSAMLEKAYIVQISDDPVKIEQARHEYDALVRGHLANMGVVALALSLSKNDERFGNAEFFETVRNGLFKDVINSGDGRTLSGAYDVITLAEETMLLNYLQVEVLQSTSAKEGVWYYNMHDVEDLRSGEPKTIFVNVTIPLEYLEQQKLKTEKALNLRN